MVKRARAIIISDKGLCVLYREKVIDGKRHIYYAIPGGHLEIGETLEECCIRELKEELGVDIEIIKLIGTIYEDGGINYYYHCKIISGIPKLGGIELSRNSSDNYYEFRYLPLDKLNDSGIRAIDFVWKVVDE